MSKTLRKVLVYEWYELPKMIVCDETKAKWKKQSQNPLKPKKMKPYIANISHSGKYGRSGYNHNHANTGFGMRTCINNANRSMKKGVRQMAKMEIKKELQDENDWIIEQGDLAHIISCLAQSEIDYTW